MFKKLSLGLAFSIALGLMACSDSSSSSGGSTTVSCKVVGRDPLVIKSSEGNISGTIGYELSDDGYALEINEFSNTAMQQEVCEEYQNSPEYSKVECGGKTVVTYSSETMTEKEFKDYIESTAAWCEASNGKKITIDDDGEEVVDLDDDDGDDDEDDDDTK